MRSELAPLDRLYVVIVRVALDGRRSDGEGTMIGKIELGRFGFSLSLSVINLAYHALRDSGDRRVVASRCRVVGHESISQCTS